MDLVKCYKQLNVELIFIIKITTYAILVGKGKHIHHKCAWKMAKGTFLGQCYRKIHMHKHASFMFKIHTNTIHKMSIVEKMRNFNIIINKNILTKRNSVQKKWKIQLCFSWPKYFFRSKYSQYLHKFLCK